MPEPAALDLENLEVRYNESLAVDDVSLAVTPGSLHVLLGANGAGKSSLARACAGLVKTSGGRVLLDGIDISTYRADKVRRAGLIYLPEVRSIFRTLTVQENLRIAVRLVGGRVEQRDALDRAFGLFPFLGDRKKQLAGRLSGGEQQMLALARALAVSPRVVIADELSLGLAPKIVDQVFNLLADMKALGTTMIVIEQYAHRALTLADHCTILRRGSVVWEGAPADVGSDLLEHYLGG